MLSRRVGGFVQLCSCGPKVAAWTSCFGAFLDICRNMTAIWKRNWFQNDPRMCKFDDFHHELLLLCRLPQGQPGPNIKAAQDILQNTWSGSNILIRVGESMSQPEEHGRVLFSPSATRIRDEVGIST